MTKDQVLTAIRKYDAALMNRGVPVEKFDTSVVGSNGVQALAHLRHMIAEMEEKANNADLWAGFDVTGKADRWIGFIQGVLWASGYGSIDDFKNDNR